MRKSFQFFLKKKLATKINCPKIFMYMTETREAKNKQIAQTMKETFKKRESQVCRVFTVKIQENQLTKIQKEQLKMIFVEAKWLKNSIIAWTKADPKNKVWNYDTKI